MVIAPEHELALEMAKNNDEIKKYINETRKKSDLERTELSKDKTGVFSGIYAINPVNNKEIPIWISDFVLASYGTGAIMSVPAHDERDEEFAKKFGLEIISVYDEKINKVINSEFLNGLNKEEAIKKMIEWISEKGIGEKTASYHLRDWIFSRQHYWGEPIPMINCSKCGWMPVPEEQLPIVLPEVEAYEPTDDGKSPLSKIESFVKTKCPKCGGEAERETDTMPNWAGSDWYFLRYIDPHNDTVLASQELMKYWCPVDVYIGGDEHNVLHLLYSRFIYKFLWDLSADKAGLGVVPKEQSEPYYKRLSHGVILGPDNQRMSKSKGNVIVPEVVADKYGVDVVRMYMMFMGPFDSTMAWNENTLMGVKRFLDRFEQFIKLQINQTESETAKNREVKVVLNKTIKNITDMIEQFKYNTAIAQMMEALNSLSSFKVKSLSSEDIKTLIKLIAPFAPYIAEELYFMVETHDRASLHEYTSVHVAEWPKADPQYLIEEEVVIMVAINGKTRSQLKINSAKQNNKDEILDLVKKDEKIIKWIGTNDIVKEIYIPGKMVNLVIKI